MHPLFQTICAPHASCFTGPSAMGLALGISAASRYCLVYYSLLKIGDHNDKRHSVLKRISKELWRRINLGTRPLRTNIIAAGEAMGGSVPRAKKASTHVRSHIRNRPKFCHSCFWKFAPHTPHASQGRRRWNLHWASPRRPGIVSCTTHYLKPATTMTNDTVY